MKTSSLLLGLLAAGCVASSRPEVSDAERSRFLLMALLEGLWEDGPDPRLLKPLLDKPLEHFVPKCPLCTPVAHAIRMYAETPDVPVYGARGSGFPAPIADGLRSPERAKRQKALEDLVARYVARRFERTGADGEMRKYLEAGKQDGMALMEPGFGDACPTCSGATRVK